MSERVEGPSSSSEAGQENGRTVLSDEEREELWDFYKLGHRNKAEEEVKRQFEYILADEDFLSAFRAGLDTYKKRLQGF